MNTIGIIEVLVSGDNVVRFAKEQTVYLQEMMKTLDELLEATAEVCKNFKARIARHDKLLSKLKGKKNEQRRKEVLAKKQFIEVRLMQLEAVIRKINGTRTGVGQRLKSLSEKLEEIEKVLKAKKK